MNKLLILFLLLLSADYCTGQDVSEIIRKVRAKQETMVDIELKYECYFKNIVSDDTNYYNYSGYLLNRKGNSFYGKLTNNVIYKRDGKVLQDTNIQLVQGVDIISAKLYGRKYYQKYKTDAVLDPVFYNGISINNLDDYKFEKEDSLFYILSSSDTGLMNNEYRVPTFNRVKIRKSDFVIVEYEDALWDFNGNDYTKEILISYQNVSASQKKRILKEVKKEWDNIQSNTFSFEEFRREIELKAQKTKDLKMGDVFPEITGFYPGTKDSLRLSELKDSIIVLDYFYTTCGPCMMAIPHLFALSEKYKGRGVGVYGIDPVSNDTGKLIAFVKKFKTPYPILGTSGEVPSKYTIEGYPTVFILDKDKKIINIFIGYRKDLEKQIEEEIIKLLKG